MTADGAVAIVGSALRFPQARSSRDYWALLHEGRVALRRFAPDELVRAGVPEARLADPQFVPVTGALDDVDRFAPEAFGIAPREALLMSPQQRLLLEIVHELLAVCGYEASSEVAIGVFAGVGIGLLPYDTYLHNQLLGRVDLDEPLTASAVARGNGADYSATRIAYHLGLTGPAVSVQTACSTSLVAVHLARQALLAGDCELAIAAAGAIHVPQVNGYLHRKGGVMSASGSCRAFDARADGTVVGNGVAAVLLKRLAAARADGDRVQAVIRGSAINNDGASKRGFHAPSANGQSAAIRRALASAGVRADTISYVQAHGTGTFKGDPVEFAGLVDAFRPSCERRGGCLLGSVKSNVGHLNACAGLAGLIAATLALQHREAPPQAAYDAPNPQLGIQDSPFRIAREPEPLVGPSPLRASVSALGVGGTNAHVVLEAAA